MLQPTTMPNTGFIDYQNLQTTTEFRPTHYEIHDYDQPPTKIQPIPTTSTDRTALELAPKFTTFFLKRDAQSSLSSVFGVALRSEFGKTHLVGISQAQTLQFSVSKVSYPVSSLRHRSPKKVSKGQSTLCCGRERRLRLADSDRLAHWLSLILTRRGFHIIRAILRVPYLSFPEHKQAVTHIHRELPKPTEKLPTSARISSTNIRLFLE